MAEEATSREVLNVGFIRFANRFADDRIVQAGIDLILTRYNELLKEEFTEEEQESAEYAFVKGDFCIKHVNGIHTGADFFTAAIHERGL